MIPDADRITHVLEAISKMPSQADLRCKTQWR